MTFKKKTFQDIYESMAVDLRERLPGLTDFDEGSVVRSLLESLAMEQAVLYQQMDLVYQSAFVNTASGPNLDKVVAILGVKRNEPDFADGVVTFVRAEGGEDEVVIPGGTLVTTEEDSSAGKVKKAYMTIKEVSIKPDETEVDVRIQAMERGKQMATGPETIIVIPSPVPGVESVINRKPVVFRGRERESDEELRERAKKALLVAGKASNRSIEQALLAMPDVRDVLVVDKTVQNNRGIAAEDCLDDGVVQIYVDGLNEDNSRQIRDRVDEVRAAGVYAKISTAEPLRIDGVFLVDADQRVLEEERRVLERQVAAVVGGVIDQTRMGEPLLVSQITSRMLEQKGVNDLQKFVMQVFDEKGGAVDMDTTKRLNAQPSERFVAGDIRVASEIKPLPVQVAVDIDYPNADVRREIGNRIVVQLNSLVPDGAALKAKLPETFKDPDLTPAVACLASYFGTAAAVVTSRRVEIDVDLLEGKTDDLTKALSAFFAGKKEEDTVTVEDIAPVVKDAFRTTVKGEIRNKLMTTIGALLADITDRALKDFPAARLKDALDLAVTSTLRDELKALMEEETKSNYRIGRLNMCVVSDNPDLYGADPAFSKSDSKAAKLTKLQAALAALQTRVSQIPAEKQALQDQLAQFGTAIGDAVDAWRKLVAEQFTALIAPANLDVYSKGFGNHSDYELTTSISARTFDDKKVTGPTITASFVERPTLLRLWAYHQELALCGRVVLSVPVSTPAVEKQRAREDFLQALTDYLDDLAPEDDLVFEDIQKLADSDDTILAVTLPGDDFGVKLNPTGTGEYLADRNKGDSIEVRPSEKVILGDLQVDV